MTQVKKFHEQPAATHDGQRVKLHTTDAHPGFVFLHMDGAGFGFCKLFSVEQARAMALAFENAADEARAQELMQEKNEAPA